MTTQLTTQNQPATGLAIFDSLQFENLYRVAEAIGKSSLIPASLKGKTDEETTANCLLVVEQSCRWGMSPFAVAQCASVIHGRLMWEGKLVHAVIEAGLGIKLMPEIIGTGEAMRIIVSGTLPGETSPRTIEGTVKQWKTTGNGSPWSNPDDYPRQLRYRGYREWARAHAPAMMLGILTQDEQLPERNVTPKPTPTSNPFNNPPSAPPAKAIAEKLPQEPLTEQFRAMVTESGIKPAYILEALVEMKALKKGQKLEELEPTRVKAMIEVWDKIESKARDIEAAKSEGGSK